MLNIIAYIINNKRNLKQFTQLVANIYQYKVENIILLNSTLRILLKNLIIISVFLAIIIVIFFNIQKNKTKRGFPTCAEGAVLVRFCPNFHWKLPRRGALNRVNN